MIVDVFVVCGLSLKLFFLSKSVKSAALGYGVMVFKMRVPAQE
jgi:hypothetical protein